MKRIADLILAAFVAATLAVPAQANGRPFQTCEEFATFLSGRIASLDRRIVTASDLVRPRLVSIRSLYRNKLHLVGTGQYSVVTIGGFPRCIRQEIESSGS